METAVNKELKELRGQEEHLVNLANLVYHLLRHHKDPLDKLELAEDLVKLDKLDQLVLRDLKDNREQLYVMFP